MEEAMVAASDRYEFLVRWQPFLLRPDTPPEGVQKAPASTDNPRVPIHLKKAGEAVGIDFTGKSDRSPSTVPSHALLEYAKEKDSKKQNELMELLFKAYFTDGTHLDADALVKLAVQVGLDEEESRRVVTDQDWLAEAREAARSWRRKGVSAVPCFLINDQRTFSGAQSAEAFLKIFDIIAERFPLEGPCAECAKV